jgi:hypothetical protein
LLEQLAGDGEFIGVSEIFEHHYHVASFLVSFGKAVLDSSAFRDFWRRYRPISTRRWAILRGEGALTRRLVAAGFRPHVLYQTEELGRQLQRCSAEQLLAEAHFLPGRYRGALLAKLSGVAADRSIPTGVAGTAQAIVDVIRQRNQMHCGGFLFRRHLGLPVVKRDIVYRGVYSLEEALANLHDLDAPLLEAVKADFGKRANPAGYGSLRWVFYRHGAI